MALSPPPRSAVSSLHRQTYCPSSYINRTGWGFHISLFFPIRGFSFSRSSGSNGQSDAASPRVHQHTCHWFSVRNLPCFALFSPWFTSLLLAGNTFSANGGKQVVLPLEGKTRERETIVETDRAPRHFASWFFSVLHSPFFSFPLPPFPSLLYYVYFSTYENAATFNCFFKE